MEQSKDVEAVCDCCSHPTDNIVPTDLRVGKVWSLCRSCSTFAAERLVEQLAFTHGAVLSQGQQVVAQKAQLEALLRVIQMFGLEQKAEGVVQATAKPQPRRKK